MGFDKISVTLYDLLGYLLPGFIFLLVCSVAEASWFGTSLFALARYKNNPIAASIIAYFLGQAGHALATWVLANGQTECEQTNCEQRFFHNPLPIFCLRVSVKTLPTLLLGASIFSSAANVGAMSAGLHATWCAPAATPAPKKITGTCVS